MPCHFLSHADHAEQNPNCTDAACRVIGQTMNHSDLQDDTLQSGSSGQSRGTPRPYKAQHTLSHADTADNILSTDDTDLTEQNPAEERIIRLIGVICGLEISAR